MNNFLTRVIVLPILFLFPGGKKKQDEYLYFVGLFPQIIEFIQENKKLSETPIHGGIASL